MCVAITLFLVAGSSSKLSGYNVHLLSKPLQKQMDNPIPTAAKSSWQFWFNLSEGIDRETFEGERFIRTLPTSLLHFIKSLSVIHTKTVNLHAAYVVGKYDNNIWTTRPTRILV